MHNAVLELFNERLPHKPYFSDDLYFGVRIAGKERAILAKYIQFNQPHAMFWLGFDVDRVGAAIDWSDRNAPAPTLTITNPENGHAHLLYALDWLADSLDLNAANDKEIVADYGLGRNCTLFDKTRKWAYRAIRQGWPEYDQWLQACYERARAYNLQFPAPLDENEVNGIAKSIAKWIHFRFTEESFEEYVNRTHSSEIQSFRGKIGGLVSRGGGRKISENSERQKKPWLSLGVGKTKYYKLKKDNFL